MNQDLQHLQSQLNLTFQNQQILKQAFTHSSYVNEHRSHHEQDNERLEFLGDAVLELAVSEFLYHKYQHLSEGELTKFRASIVCEPSLVNFAKSLHFGSYVLLGKGEEMTGGRSRPALLADVFEAFIGALFLDQGWPVVQSFLEQHVFSSLLANDSLRIEDFKTQLQEEIQREGMGAVEYRIVDEKGPAHDRFFSCEVVLHEKVMGRGSGRSKKEAEQQAAAHALDKLKNQSKS